MLRLPFGYRIEAEPTQQGRTYFDRFISIVKVALMEENAAHEAIAYSPFETSFRRDSWVEYVDT